MRPLIFLGLFFSLPSFAQTFKFALHSEPHSLDPVTLSGTETAYLFTNLYRGLYRYDNERGLVPEGAESCRWQKTMILICQLNRQMKWSSGEPVLAGDYVRAFRRVIDPQLKSREAGLLLSLKNAKKIIESKEPPEKLGIFALNDYRLQFEFDEKDYEFIDKLSSQVLIPIRRVSDRKNPETYLFNGPYKIREWKYGVRVWLDPNPHYPFGNKARPPVEVLFVEGAETSLTLYRMNQLSFLQMLPTAEVPAFIKSSDYMLTPLAKFDYIGFGPQLKAWPQLRKALAHAPNYEEFRALFDSSGPPGCTSLPDSFFIKPPCIKYDLPAAKKNLEGIDLKTLPKLLYSFTKIGTDDLRRGAEWYQAQWKKNLGLSVELTSKELQVYRQELRTHPTPLFRVGISLDRPTCLAALETFHSQSPDNHIKYKSKKYDEVVETLKRTRNLQARRKLCEKGARLLLNDYALIPQGKIHHSRLLRQNFKGLKINSLGQIDLSHLESVSK